MKTILTSALVLSMLAVATSTVAAEGPPPSVSQPSGINLGNTSFYDGFAGPPGLSHLTYLKYNSASSFRDKDGNKNNSFSDLRLNTAQLLNQLSYYSPHSIGMGAHLGWNLIVPIVYLDGDFSDGGAKLKDNATGLGDITTGPQAQFDLITDKDGRPLFIQRFGADFILPTGKYDKHKDINESSNFYSFNPYWAATLMPAPRWELSWRLYYLYNFKNDSPASSSPQSFNGQTVRETQAGQSAWANFAFSYEVVPNVSVGLNGFYFKQLADDKVNGDRLEDSREQVLGVGPGLFVKGRKEGQGLWLNVYKESNVENRARNDFSVQLRIAHAF